MNHNDYISFDTETTGLIPGVSEVIQVAGKAYRGRTLEPYSPEEGGEFCSMMKVVYPKRLTAPSVAHALSKNGKTIEEIMAAPEQKIVWNSFIEWVMRFNKKKNHFGAPILIGKNVRDFDMKFVAILNEMHTKKKEKTILFHRKRLIEFEDLMFLWFENEAEPSSYGMDELRKFFDIPMEGAHDALVDCQQVGEMAMRFLRLKRNLQKRLAADGSKLIKFKGCWGAKANG